MKYENHMNQQSKSGENKRFQTMTNYAKRKFGILAEYILDMEISRTLAI